VWNYRVVRRKHPGQDPQSQAEHLTYSYGIHEAYYDQSEHVTMITQDAVEPFGETIEELRHMWVMMAEAFAQPLLDYDMIPELGYDDTYEARTDEAKENYMTEEEMVDDAWGPMASQELSDFHMTQEHERVQLEQRHGQEFVGVKPLKSLLDAVYNDYMSQHERHTGEEDDE
jgi:hypothetical protein